MLALSAGVKLRLNIFRGVIGRPWEYRLMSPSWLRDPSGLLPICFSRDSLLLLLLALSLDLLLRWLRVPPVYTIEWLPTLISKHTRRRKKCSVRPCANTPKMFERWG